MAATRSLQVLGLSFLLLAFARCLDVDETCGNAQQEDCDSAGLLQVSRPPTAEHKSAVFDPPLGSPAAVPPGPAKPSAPRIPAPTAGQQPEEPGSRGRWALTWWRLRHWAKRTWQAACASAYDRARLTAFLQFLHPSLLQVEQRSATHDLPKPLLDPDWGTRGSSATLLCAVMLASVVVISLLAALFGAWILGCALVSGAADAARSLAEHKGSPEPLEVPAPPVSIPPVPTTGTHAIDALAAALEERRRGRRWPRPLHPTEVMPALLPDVLSSGSKYHPLSAQLPRPGVGRVQIAAGFSKTPLYAAELTAGSSALVITDIHDYNRTVASIDSSLQIRNADGAFFGQLQSCGPDRYLLQEPARANPRWVFSATSDGGMTVSWQRERSIYSRLVGSAPGGQVVAAASKVGTKNSGDLLEIRGVDGCDLLLVLLCVFGLRVLSAPEQLTVAAATADPRSAA